MIFIPPQIIMINQPSYNCYQIQMYKRKDNDIFGTNNIGYAPRIENNKFIDPNAAFKKKTQQNYQKYVANMTNYSSSITSQPLDCSKVNENAQFDDDYHKNRKEKDLQSSIFYPPTAKVHIQQQKQTQINRPNTQQMTFGRKQTFKREINQLPYNNTGFKGNSSKLFDLDQRIKPRIQENNSMTPLIPYQMKWDQHDSVKYAHINDPLKSKRQDSNLNLQNINQSKSTVFNQEQICQNVNKANTIVSEKDTITSLKKVKSEKELKKMDVPKTGKQPVEIKILRGWDYKLMEGLSKHCKLNGAGIMKFEAEQGDKATLLIKRSERWENVTDWLRKDAKLRIRVINP